MGGSSPGHAPRGTLPPREPAPAGRERVPSTAAVALGRLPGGHPRLARTRTGAATCEASKPLRLEHLRPMPALEEVLAVRHARVDGDASQEPGVEPRAGR